MRDEALVEKVLDSLRASGLTLAGTCSAEVPAADRSALAAWNARGLGGPLGYMPRTERLRIAPGEWLPWVRGAFCAAMAYNTRRDMSASTIAGGRAWVSRYAWGRDYHKVLRARMGPAARLLRAAGFRARVCVDTAPVLERALAAKAGLGFVGKNGLLIHPHLGSYLFLGEILTDLPLGDGERVPDGCGECRLCLRGCPTGALTAPGVLDARLCLSTWTIEHRGPFPREAPALHGHLFGCDRCQEVCPYNRRAPLSGEAEFQPREPWFAPEPGAVAAMGAEEWDRATTGSAVRRAGHGGLRRNALRILEERSPRET